MMKWLLLGVVIVAVLWWLGRGRRAHGGAKPDSASTPSPGSPNPSAGQRAPSAQPEPMVACAHCGVLLPRSDAVADGDAGGDAGGEPGGVTGGHADGQTKPTATRPFYCSQAHRRAGPGRA
jgi:uncharacterized protein